MIHQRQPAGQSRSRRVLSFGRAQQAIGQIVDGALGRRDRGFRSGIGEFVIFDRDAVEVGYAKI